MGWDYAREEAPRLEPGDYRVEIVDAQDAVSKTSNNPMIVITIRPNNSNIKIKHYIVKNQYFNRNMTEFFDSFPQIQEGDFNLLGWVGCVGAAKLKDDGGYLKVKYFIHHHKALNLPDWVGPMPERQTITELTSFQSVDPLNEDDLPF